jgi:hypothetical protein
MKEVEPTCVMKSNRLSLRWWQVDCYDGRRTFLLLLLQTYLQVIHPVRTFDPLARVLFGATAAIPSSAYGAV